MKKLTILLFATFASLLSLRAEEAANPNWGKAADNKIFAQTLVNELVAKNPDVVVVGLHAIAPGATDSKMIAANIDRIGKDDDDDDKVVATDRKTICAPNLKDPSKFEVQVPLKDAAGNVIGACAFVFHYQAGGDEVEMHRKAVALRDGLQKRLPNKAALFQIKH